MADRIKIRRDTGANWTSNDPVLADGEIGWDKTNAVLKVGDGSTAWSSLTAVTSAHPIGMIGAFAASTPPTGWLACDGSAVSRTTYSSLFSVIGTTWGVGDGSTTFNLPDLQGAFLRGTGSHGSETMADSNAYAGPSVGSFEDDQMQGHIHSLALDSAPTSTLQMSNTTGSTTTSLAVGNGAYHGSLRARGIVDDGTNGTPRTGDETRPFAAGVKYCIKAT